MLSVLAALTAGLALWDKSGGNGFALFTGVILCYSAVNLCSYCHDMPDNMKAFAVGLVIALACSVRIYHAVSLPQPPNRTVYDVTGTVSGLREWGKNYVATIDADNGERYIARMRFAEMMEGTRIEFSGITQALRPSASGFSEVKFWSARGVTSWVNLRDVRELPEKFSLARMRYRLSRSLAMYAPTLTGEYLRAAWLGERNKELNEKHRRWGTSHLLAVSGFHVGIIIIVMMHFFGTDALMLSVVMWAYVLLTGAAPSAMRAGLMIQAGLLAKMLGRKADGVNSVSVAGVLLLAWRPFLFWDVGFRLSVLSAMTITMLVKKEYAWLIISPVIFIVTFPQVAYTFRDVPIVGIILNVAAPAYFFFAFTAASCVMALRLAGLPFMKYVLLAAEGGFMLWEHQAETSSVYIPVMLRWNYFTAWIGAGVFLLCVCRYFGFSYGRTLGVMTAGSVAAFMMFL